MCIYGSIEVVERRCLGWDSGVVKGLMLRFESQVGWLRWEVVGDRARYSVNRQLIGRLRGISDVFPQILGRFPNFSQEANGVNFPVSRHSPQGRAMISLINFKLFTFWGTRPEFQGKLGSGVRGRHAGSAQRCGGSREVVWGREGCGV